MKLKTYGGGPPDWRSIGAFLLVRCTGVVRISGSPFRGVPLYIATYINSKAILHDVGKGSDLNSEEFSFMIVYSLYIFLLYCVTAVEVTLIFLQCTVEPL